MGLKQETAEAPGWITDSEFERFRDFFYTRTGIYFDDKKRYFVDKRLVERILKTGHDTFRSYFTFLRFQPSSEELQKLVNLLTVNETYFFREDYQFACLVNSVLGEVVAGRPAQQPVRIWCMPCSTGEEVYSIAIYLTEHWKELDRVDVELVASDINTQALDSCQLGSYGKHSTHTLTNDLLARYFQHQKDGTYRINEDIRASVNFCRANLHEVQQLRWFRGFDVVFCRNLLIYFDDQSRSKAAGTLYDALSPGGFLFLGHSESMSRMSSLFRVRRFSNAIVYQKPY